MKKPEAGDLVESKNRAKNGRVVYDTGEITRITDGGYCLVKWDSDGEIHEVLLASLHPRKQSSRFEEEK